MDTELIKKWAEWLVKSLTPPNLPPSQAVMYKLNILAQSWAKGDEDFLKAQKAKLEESILSSQSEIAVIDSKLTAISEVKPK